MSTERITVYCCEVCAKPVETNYPERCDDFDHVLQGAVPREFVLASERDRLAEALRPFVEAYERTGWEFCPEFNGPKDLAMFDRARAALSGEEER